MKAPKNALKLTKCYQITEGSLCDPEIVLIDVYVYGRRGSLSVTRRMANDRLIRDAALLAALPYEQKFSPRATPDGRQRKIMRVIEQREIVGLYDLNDDLSLNDIAKRRRKPFERVRSQYKRGRVRLEKLRAEMDDRAKAAKAQRRKGKGARP
jgi:hypothetical protein